jgi:hypothetical protein
VTIPARATPMATPGGKRPIAAGAAPHGTRRSHARDTRLRRGIRATSIKGPGPLAPHCGTASGQHFRRSTVRSPLAATQPTKRQPEPATPSRNPPGASVGCTSGGLATQWHLAP